MTAEDHLKLMIGDLVVTVAKLQAELDARPPAPDPPAPPKEGSDGPA